MHAARPIDSSNTNVTATSHHNPASPVVLSPPQLAVFVHIGKVHGQARLAAHRAHIQHPGGGVEALARGLHAWGRAAAAAEDNTLSNFSAQNPASGTSPASGCSAHEGNTHGVTCLGRHVMSRRIWWVASVMGQSSGSTAAVLCRQSVAGWGHGTPNTSTGTPSLITTIRSTGYCCLSPFKKGTHLLH